jgi:hypothetical protein
VQRTVYRWAWRSKRGLVSHKYMSLCLQKLHFLFVNGHSIGHVREVESMHLQARVIKANHNIRAQSNVPLEVDANSLGSLTGGSSAGGHLGVSLALSSSHSSLAYAVAATTSATVYDVMAHLRDMVVSHPYSLSASAFGSSIDLAKRAGSATLLPVPSSAASAGEKLPKACVFHTQLAVTSYVVPAVGGRIVLDGASVDIPSGVMRAPDVVGLEAVVGDTLETSLASMHLTPTSRIFYLSPRDRCGLLGFVACMFPSLIFGPGFCSTEQ